MNDKLKNIRRKLMPQAHADGRTPFHPILMMHAARMAGYTYEQFMRDYRILVESNLVCLEEYGHDAVSVISDPYRETAAFGAEITFDGDNSPRASKVINSTADIASLRHPDIYACERTLDRIRGVELYRKRLGPDFPVVGWVEGPLAEAGDLMGVSEVMMAMILEPESVSELIAKTLAVAKDFALAQIKAGAGIIGVGDAICSQISPDMYGLFCFKAHRELFDLIHSNGALVKLHICGDITYILPYLAKEGVDILDVDWMVDLAGAYEIMGSETVLSGNLDPVSVVMNGDTDTIKNKYAIASSALPAENWILSAGCEIPVATDPGKVRLLRQLSLAK